MPLQNHRQSFSPQNVASPHPSDGTRTFPTGAQPASYTYNDVHDPPFTHPMPSPWQAFQNDQSWMLGQPMGAGPTLMMQDWALNPNISIAPLHTPSWSNPRATHGNHHSAGVPLGMSTVEHR
jgi:hypothetical protein